MGILDFLPKKTPTPDAEPVESDDEFATRHCFVLCNASEPSDVSHAGEVVAEVFGQGHSADVSEKNIISVMCGDETIGFLAHMPMPHGEADENADGNFLWPDGRRPPSSTAPMSSSRTSAAASRHRFSQQSPCLGWRWWRWASSMGSASTGAMPVSATRVRYSRSFAGTFPKSMSLHCAVLWDQPGRT